MAYQTSFIVSHNAARATLILKSNGWSGTPVNRNSSDIDNRKFQLSVDYNINNDNFQYIGKVTTTANSYGYVAYNGNSAFIGISLEHMGEVSRTSGGLRNQFLGLESNGSTIAPAWGSDGSSMTVNYGAIYISEYDYVSLYNGSSGTSSNVKIENVEAGNNNKPFDMICYDQGNWESRSSCIITTDLPIFETDADFIEYANSGGTITNKILNLTDPEEEFENMGEFYRLYNYYSINSNRGPTTIRTYRFKPYGQSRNRICFYRKSPTESDPTDLVLYHLDDSTCYRAYTVSPDDEDFEEVSSSSIPDKYISLSRAYGDNYVKVYNFDSNIPIFSTQSLADDYVNEIIDIEAADNFDDLIREDNSITMADWDGTDTEEETDHGENGQEYLVGARMYALTLTQLSAFFVEIFNGDNFQDFLNGTQIFGQNQINAITGLAYLPITDLSTICSLQSATNISVGAWRSNAQGVPIKNNKGLIDCGTFTMTPTYNDFRDLEPYFTLSVWLPYIGCYPLSMAKYLGTRVNVSYAVDVTTGGCTAYISANGIVLDSFDGTMGSQRPITSQDNARWLSSVVNGIMDVSGQIAGGGSSAIQGALAGASSGNIVSAVSGGMISAATTGVTGVYKGYDLMNTFNDPPMSTRGAYSGNLGYFGSQKVRFIIGQKRNSRPKNELNLIGYPSNTSGHIADYNGFLKCSNVKLSSSFNGTASEQTELLNILRNGVYV